MAFNSSQAADKALQLFHAIDRWADDPNTQGYDETQSRPVFASIILQAESQQRSRGFSFHLHCMEALGQWKKERYGTTTTCSTATMQEIMW